MQRPAKNIAYLDKFTVRKVQDTLTQDINSIPDSLGAWMAHYLHLAISGVRSEAVTKKIALHLSRFHTFFVGAYGHDRISTMLKRDVVAWQTSLKELGLAHSTINNCLASLSGFTTWVHALNAHVFPAGNPTKGVGELGLPPLEPRALSKEQVRSLKNVCDRLEHFHHLKGRRQKDKHKTNTHGRPWRDRAIVYVLLSTGLRREELVRLDLDQVEPSHPEALRKARSARITNVRGRGKTRITAKIAHNEREFKNIVF